MRLISSKTPSAFHAATISISQQIIQVRTASYPVITATDLLFREGLRGSYSCAFLGMMSTRCLYFFNGITKNLINPAIEPTLAADSSKCSSFPLDCRLKDSILDVRCVVFMNGEQSERTQASYSGPLQSPSAVLRGRRGFLRQSCRTWQALLVSGSWWSLRYCTDCKDIRRPITTVFTHIRYSTVFISCDPSSRT